MSAPVILVPTGAPDVTMVWRSPLGGAVAAGSTLYQAMPCFSPAWLRTNSAVNPHSGAKLSGVVFESAIQSIASPRDEKKAARVVSVETEEGPGTTSPLGSVVVAWATEGMTTASAQSEAKKER